MLRSTLGLGLAAALTLSVPAAPLPAQDADLVATTDPWTREELENLLAPIALYPDPILAQVLVAATYPDQVLAAQAHVRAFGQDNIDIQPWQLSVKAVARYEPVLNLMAEGEDWMVALGQAYATQPVDVMNSVQSLRQMANAQGNLVSTPQQQVVVEREVIRIVPAQPQVIYVPTYDPAVVYFRPIYVARAHPAYWHWGAAYPIGVWLTYDFDWWGHRVYYHGWHAGPSWVVVSRPFVVINPFYVSPRHTTIVVNRRVVNRHFDGRRLRKYTVVHRNTTFDRRGRGPDRRDVARGGRDDRDDRDDRGRVGPPNGTPRGNNGNRGLGPDRGNDRNRGVGPRGAAPGAGDARADRRVVPIPSGATRRTGLTTDRGADNDARESTRSVLRQSNGTWNPRASRSTPTPAPQAGAAPSRSSREIIGGSANRRPTAVAPGASTTAPRSTPQPPHSSRAVIGGAADRRPTAAPSGGSASRSGGARPSGPPSAPSARPSSPSRAPTARPSRAPSSGGPAASPRSGGSARGAVSGARSAGGSRGGVSRGSGGSSGRRGGGGGE